MSRLSRIVTPLLILLTLQLAVAQEAKPAGDPHLSFLDRVELITRTWWLSTMVGAILLGLLVGFFVYRSAVAGGRAGSATSSGCLVAVIVFLATQVFAVFILVYTVFTAPLIGGAKPVDAQTEQTSPKSTPASDAPKSTSSGATTTTGTPKTGTTTGDDF